MNARSIIAALVVSMLGLFVVAADGNTEDPGRWVISADRNCC